MEILVNSKPVIFDDFSVFSIKVNPNDTLSIDNSVFTKSKLEGKNLHLHDEDETTTLIIENYTENLENVTLADSYGEVMPSYVAETSIDSVALSDINSPSQYDAGLLFPALSLATAGGLATGLSGGNSGANGLAPNECTNVLSSREIIDGDIFSGNIFNGADTLSLVSFTTPYSQGDILAGINANMSGFGNLMINANGDYVFSSNEEFSGECFGIEYTAVDSDNNTVIQEENICPYNLNNLSENSNDQYSQAYLTPPTYNDMPASHLGVLGG